MAAVYASAADLKTLTAALSAMNTAYSFSSLWNLPADVEREDASLAEKAGKPHGRRLSGSNGITIRHLLSSGASKTAAPHRRSNRKTAAEIRRQREGGGCRLSVPRSSPG